VELRDANELLEPRHLPLESGWMRLPDGQIHVACWTAMPRCTGAMVAWWFGWLETTEQYKWWHPKDHVWCEWVGERGTGRFVGGEHHVHEFIGGELQKLKIQFRDPVEYLDAGCLDEAGVTAGGRPRSRGPHRRLPRPDGRGAPAPLPRGDDLPRGLPPGPPREGGEPVDCSPRCEA